MKKYILIIFLLLTSCDLFETREPEIPSIGGNAFVAPTEPDILFSNLIASFKDKVLDNYMSCFVDPSFSQKEFKFIPSAGSISQFPDMVSWDLNAERTYFNNLSTVPGEGMPITLSFSNKVNNPLGDSAVYQFDYTLLVPISGETEGNTYKGSVIFKIYRDTRQQWAIGEWEDIKQDNFVSWSELKGNYY